MVKIIKRTYMGGKVILGERQNRGLVFVVNKKGHVKQAFTTEEAKQLGIVSSTPRQQRPRRKQNNNIFDFDLGF